MYTIYKKCFAYYSLRLVYIYIQQRRRIEVGCTHMSSAGFGGVQVWLQCCGGGSILFFFSLKKKLACLIYSQIQHFMRNKKKK